MKKLEIGACNVCHGEGEYNVPTYPGSGTVAKRTCRTCKGSGVDPIQYEEYKQRRAEFYPERDELIWEEFVKWAYRWSEEYHNAWYNGPDMGTIGELETALCV